MKPVSFVNPALAVGISLAVACLGASAVYLYRFQTNEWQPPA